jgi:hypothetical protein
MASGYQHVRKSKMNLMMAGVEAGVLGGLFVIVWLGILSLLQGRSLWSVPNLLASTFYGEMALRRGFRWSSLSGVALQLTVSSIAGMLFGLAVSGIASRSRVMILGVATGLAWYFLSVGVFWKYVNPMVPLYARGGGMLLAHLGMGFFLGSFPRYVEALDSGSAEAPPPLPPEVVTADPSGSMPQL